MKKFILVLALALSTHIVSAQTKDLNQRVNDLIENQDFRSQLLLAKESLNEYILVDKKDAFSDDFHKLVTSFLSKISQTIITNLSEEEIEKVLLDEKKPEGGLNFDSISPDKKLKIEQELQKLQDHLNIDLNELFLNYRNPELFQE